MIGRRNCCENRGLSPIILLLQRMLTLLIMMNLLSTATQIQIDTKYPETQGRKWRKYSSAFRAFSNYATGIIRETIDLRMTKQGVVFLALQNDSAVELENGGAISCPPAAPQLPVLQVLYGLPHDGALTPAEIEEGKDSARAYVDITILREGLVQFKAIPKVRGAIEIQVEQPVIKLGYKYKFFPVGIWSQVAQLDRLCN